MLTDFLLNTFAVAIDWLIGVRPPWDIALPDGLIQFVTQCVSWDWIFPVHEIFIMLGIAITGFSAIFGVKWAVKLSDWIADIIP